MQLKKDSILYRIAILFAISSSALVLMCALFGYSLFDNSGWHTAQDGTCQYLDRFGDPLLGWQEIDGGIYFFSPLQNGSMVTGWLETDGEHYYLLNNGTKTTGWADLDGSHYYFNDVGVMQTGWVDTIEGRYYLSDEGILQTGLFTTPDGLFYCTENGEISPGWTETEQGRIYINADGSVHTGWLELDGETYYLTEQGPMQTGWFEQGEDRYYFLDDGSMAIGRVEIDGVARHFTSTGKYFVLVNPWNYVPDDYTWDLVQIDEEYQMDASCVDALAQMRRDCEAAGYSCKISSAYRSFDYQTTLFQRKVTKLMGQGYSQAAAEAETGRSIAIPGTSEHQLGLAVDLKNTYSTYDWLAEHSWEYGFILRYPADSIHLTGIYYEPWHFRYVGKELAAELFDLGICVEAYMDMLTEKEK